MAWLGERGEAGSASVGFGEQHRRAAFACRLAGEAERERGGARAADQRADGEQRAAGFVEAPARTTACALGLRAAGEADAGG